MAKQILGTFQSRDAADAVKDALMAEGFPAHNLVVMTNKQEPQPPEDAQLEVGEQGEPGDGRLRGEGGQGGAEDDGKEERDRGGWI